MQPEASAPRATLNLYGPVVLRGEDGGVPIAIASRRGRVVLAVIALHRSATAARTRLMSLLWGDRAETQARASLRQCLTELRAATAELRASILDVSREHVRLRVEGLAVDVLELNDALERRDVSAVIGHLERIGGDLLCDEPPVSEAHEEWLQQVRAQNERHLAAGVHSLLAEHANSDPPVVRLLADLLLNRHPLDEEAVAAAIFADVALGAAAAAVLRFSAFKATLAREIQVAPGTAVQKAHNAALAASISTRPATPRESVSDPGVFKPPTVIVRGFSSTTEANERLSLSLREDILAALSRFRELAVVSEPRAGDAEARDLWEGRENIYLMSGMIHERSAGARLVVQLIRMTNGAVVLSDEAQLSSDAGAIIENVVARVAAAALPAIEADLVVPGALPLGLYGRFSVARARAAAAPDWNTAKAAAAALEAFIEDVPTANLAYLPLARLYNTDFGFTRAGSSGPIERGRAFELCKAALALDRRHSHAYTVMGWCYLWRRGWEAARRHFDHAVELNPFNAERLMEVGFGSLFLGELEHSRSLLERCLRLNPAPRDGFFMDLGLLEMIEGRHDLAQAHFDMIASPSVFDDVYLAANGVLAASLSDEHAVIAYDRVAAIWPPGQDCGADAMTRWFADAHPFRDESVAFRLTNAVRHALKRAEQLKVLI